ncbi:MAG TPA: hypothetical protein DIW64_04845 [Cellvibrio sp.]|nr:hypothetical protein [Cellvibrio sp.]
MVVLILSILLPLQVMAGALLTVSPCAMEIKMGDTDSNYIMPCCPDETELSNTNSCKTIKTCHLCKTPGQIYLPATTIFTSLTDLSLLAKPPLTRPADINPASIWRPPSFS